MISLCKVLKKVGSLGFKVYGIWEVGFGVEGLGC